MTADSPRAESDADNGAVIRDAACLIVIDEAEGAPRLLMGQRLDTQVFLPGLWVFPGGRVDDDDHAAAAVAWRGGGGIALSPAVRPFAFAAVRELFEETGLIAGVPPEDGGQPPSADFKGGWRDFAATGYLPVAGHMTPIARAITPPGRPRRYDTWFFTVPRSVIAASAGDGDGELRNLGWFTIAAARRLDLPNITRLVLDDVADGLSGAGVPSPGQVPFYHHDGCGFRRSLCTWHEASTPY